MFSLIKNKKKFEKVMASVAQVLIIVILLPFISVLIYLFMPEKIGSFILTVLDEIPIINVLSNYYTAFAGSESLSSFSLFEYIINAVNESIMSMYIVGLFVFIIRRVSEFKIIGMKGIPVLQTVVGIFLSAICLKYIGNSVEANIICSIVLMIVAFVLSVIIQKVKIGKFLWDTGLGMGMATITSGTVSAYLTVLVLIIKGWFDSFLSAINVLIWSLIPALICLFVDYLLFGEKE